MNRAATAVFHTLTDITLAYGHSDEYSFLFPPSTTLYSRRLQKLVSTVTSVFTSAYVAYWDNYFEGATATSIEGQDEGGEGGDGRERKGTAVNLDLFMLPSFDGRAVLLPAVGNVRDYFAWRQVDCHVNCLYNTVFWAMVKGSTTAVAKTAATERDRDEIHGANDEEQQQEQKQDQQAGHETGSQKLKEGGTKRKIPVAEGMPQTEAELRLKGTTSADKNEILWRDYGINYNDVSNLERKGSVVWREMSTDDELHHHDSTHQETAAGANLPVSNQTTAVPAVISKTQADKAKRARRKAEVVVGYADIIKDAFWRERTWILGR